MIWSQKEKADYLRKRCSKAQAHTWFSKNRDLTVMSYYCFPGAEEINLDLPKWHRWKKQLPNLYK